MGVKTDDSIAQGVDIVPTALAVTAMRDNGYRNAAYALAELMDNSIQANATKVELICFESELLVSERVRRRVKKVAVLDNGIGMDRHTLQIALQFGNGSRLEEGKTSGMGRFGMGLPSASISQCRRVDVWTWTDGPESSLHTYIDLDEIEKDGRSTLPEPKIEAIPDEWIERASDEKLGNSGTLVVWSKIDRMMWGTARALLDNSESLIGRMYRKWIGDGSVAIRLTNYCEDDPNPTRDEYAKPNDPMYLMENTSCPEPWDSTPMFEAYPDEKSNEIPVTIRWNGADHIVRVRLSVAKDVVRKKPADAGRSKAGQHAKRNIGVSIVRAGRELDLDQGLVNSHDTRERWWGAEVEFEPGLDDLMGVSNNKQSARNLTEALSVDIDDLMKQNKGDISAARAQLEDDGDPIAPLLEVVFRLSSNIANMRNLVAKQAEGKRRRDRHDKISVEENATAEVRRRQEEGHEGGSDADEKLPAEEREKELADDLERRGHARDEAESMAAELVDKGLKYRIEPDHLEGGAFFSVQPKGGVIIVSLNLDHPAYELLLGAGKSDSDSDDIELLKSKLSDAQRGLEMMLLAWARYEDEQYASRDALRRTQNIRHDWGRMAERFLESDSEIND